jgi:hypothetical protein
MKSPMARAYWASYTTDVGRRNFVSEANDRDDEHDP